MESSVAIAVLSVGVSGIYK
ncbi:hypothetical protein LS75_005380 [Helicobacter typhlonius]|uniref:Uncharacterized protein n=1 Tax=Helicobacter typhlonius TaxID=76936 RepID=A0A4U8RZ58_9HELI|nr:hypothetical protein LS75_005380 [Helicobacter typhlonius]TLD88892.1 hypothetical protein LS67_003650 [Helicobacter sp. MIT 03-1616]